MKTIIHVGLHKTATTYLQEIVFPHVKGYTYLTRPYTQHNFAFNKLQYADTSLYNYSETIGELKQINSEKLLISDESLSGKPIGFGYINRSLVAERLAHVFPEAEIILFIRGQQDIILSQYNMWVKGYNSGYRKISDFVWYPKKNYTYQDKLSNSPANLNTLFWNTNEFYLNLDCYKYFELISLYKKFFKKVHVFLYEDFKYEPKNVLEKISSILEEKIEIVDEELEKKVNISLAQESLIKKIHENKANIITNNRWLKKLLVTYLNYRDEKFSDPKAYIGEITKNVYENNNRKLIEEYPEVGIQNYPNEYRTSANRP